MPNSYKPATILLVCLLLAGCVGARARCRISVANACDENISHIVVRDEAGNTYAFADLAKHSVGTYMRVKTDMGRDVTLTITGEDGAPSTKVVRLDRVVPQTFDGCVLFQIESHAGIRAFVLPQAERSSESELPWAVPPAWQGVPGIPGLSDRE